MTIRSTSLVALVALGVVVGCGGKPPEAKAPQQAAVKSSPVAVAEEKPDLSPVEAPGTLFFVARVRNPGAVTDAALSWAALPVDWRGLLDAASPDIRKTLVEDAPLDAVMALDPSAPEDDPEPFIAFSVGLRSVDGLLDVVQKAGEAKVERLPRGTARIAADKLTCIAAPSVGSSPARLVCGPRQEDVDALAPYMSRGLPLENLGKSDVHVAIMAEPFRRLWGPKIAAARAGLVPMALHEFSLDEPRFDRDLADGLQTLADEVGFTLDELDSLSIDGAVVPGASKIDLSTSLRLSGQRSWLSKVVASSAGAAHAAPEAFWKLPADSSAASWSYSTKTDMIAPLRASLAELADAGLEHAKAPGVARSSARQFIEALLTPVPSSLFAQGELAEAERVGASPTAVDFGWRLYGYQEASSRYVGLADALVKLSSDKATRKAVTDSKWFEGQVGEGLKPQELPTFKALPTPKGLPKGSKLYSFDVSKSAVAKLTPEVKKALGLRGEGAVSWVFAVVPDGEWTWIGVSAEKSVLLDRLGLVAAGKPDKTLAGRRKAFAAEVSKPAVAAGFVSLAGILRGAELPHAQVELQKLPKKGLAPIPFRIEAVGGAGSELTMRLTADRGLAADLMAIFPLLVKARSLGGASGSEEE